MSASLDSISIPRTKNPNDSVKVAVRVRPASLAEKVGSNYKSMVRCVDSTMLVFDPDETSHGFVQTGAATRRRVRRRTKLRCLPNSVNDFHTARSRRPGARGRSRCLALAAKSP